MFKLEDLENNEDFSIVYSNKTFEFKKPLHTDLIVCNEIESKEIVEQLLMYKKMFDLTIEQINYYFENKYLEEMSKFVVRNISDYLGNHLDSLKENPEKILAIKNNKIRPRVVRERVSRKLSPDLGWLRYLKVNGQDYFLFLTYNYTHSQFSQFPTYKLLTKESVIESFNKKEYSFDFKGSFMERTVTKDFLNMPLEFKEKIEKDVLNLSKLQKDLLTYFDIDISEQLFNHRFIKLNTDLEKMFSHLNSVYNIHHHLNTSLCKEYPLDKYIVDKHNTFLVVEENEFMDIRGKKHNYNDLNMPITLPTEFVENSSFYTEILNDFKGAL